MNSFRWCFQAIAGSLEETQLRHRLIDPLKESLNAPDMLLRTGSLVLKDGERTMSLKLDTGYDLDAVHQLAMAVFDNSSDGAITFLVESASEEVGSAIVGRVDINVHYPHERILTIASGTLSLNSKPKELL